MTTACSARPFGDHDYSQPPHNTPDSPRDSEGVYDPCQAGWDGCQDDRRYEVTIYQPGTHEWIRMQACTSCTAAMREQAGPHGGPGGAPGVARVTTATRPVEPLPSERCVCDQYGSCPKGCPWCPVCGGQAA